MRRDISLLAVVAVVAGSARPAAAPPVGDEWNVLVAEYLMGASMKSVQ